MTVDTGVAVALIAAGSSLVIAWLNARRTCSRERAEALEARIDELERLNVGLAKQVGDCDQHREQLIRENRSLLVENVDLLRRIYAANGVRKETPR